MDGEEHRHRRGLQGDPFLCLNPTMAITRREVRERVMQALYALEQGGGDAREVLDTVLLPALEEAEPATRRFGERLFLLALDYNDQADELVGDQVKNWEIERIALVDHVLLRLAITEFLGFEDIPPKVTINEAIEIAKRYSTHKSGQFVNGVLDGVLARLREEGRLKKAGRGLVGSTPGQPSAPRVGAGGDGSGNARARRDAARQAAKAAALAAESDGTAGGPEASPDGASSTGDSSTGELGTRDSSTGDTGSGTGGAPNAAASDDARTDGEG